jgi:hypothetical protein
MTRDPYRRLDPLKIVETANKLHDRIEERFPGAGLAAVAADVVRVTGLTVKRARAVSRPYWGLNALVILLIAAGALAEAWLAGQFGWSVLGRRVDPINLAQGLDSAFNLILLTAGGAFFLLTLDSRWKRQRIQRWLNELRAIAHVVDMHQLTKDPTARGGPRTTSSPDRAMTRYELTRYLDYCAEILALIGKLAALYAGASSDHLAISAAGDIETLCSDLNRKIWQKIMILAEQESDAGAGNPAEGAA